MAKVKSETSFEASLLFDEDVDREVATVRSDPLEYVSHVSPDKKEVVMEVRIKVLSTQLENSLFKVKISARQGGNECSVKSDPIRAVSKPEQIRRRKAQASNPVKQQASKKRARSSDVFEALEELKSNQLDQMILLQQLVENSKVIAQNQRPLSQFNVDAPVLPLVSPDQNNTTTKFEDAFNNFLVAYNNLPVGDRPTKIRKVIREASNSSPEDITEVINLFYTEGLAQPPPSTKSHSETNGPCACTDCHFKKELEQMDQFYTEFLSTTLS